MGDEQSLRGPVPLLLNVDPIGERAMSASAELFECNDGRSSTLTIPIAEENFTFRLSRMDGVLEWVVAKPCPPETCSICGDPATRTAEFRFRGPLPQAFWYMWAVGLPLTLVAFSATMIVAPHAATLAVSGISIFGTALGLATARGAYRRHRYVFPFSLCEIHGEEHQTLHRQWRIATGVLIGSVILGLVPGLPLLVLCFIGDGPREWLAPALTGALILMVLASGWAFARADKRLRAHHGLQAAVLPDHLEIRAKAREGNIERPWRATTSTDGDGVDMITCSKCGAELSDADRMGTVAFVCRKCGRVTRPGSSRSI